MITPLDIENRVFKKKIFGYDELDVEEFLTKIVEDYEQLYRENIELKDKVAALNEGIQQYKSMEETLQNTLIVAQNTGEDIKNNAHSKAENIIKEAEIKAAKIIDGAEEEIKKMTYRYEQIKRNINVFKAKAESMLYSQLEIFKDFNSENED